MKKSIVLIPLPSLIKNSFVRSLSLSLSLFLHHDSKGISSELNFGSREVMLFM